MAKKINSGLLPKQGRALAYLMDNSTTFLLYGGAIGGGKSWLGCFWLWYMCRKYPHTVYFLARRQMIDITRSTLQTFYKVLRHIEGNANPDYDPDRFWKYSSAFNTITHRRNGAKIVFIATEYMPADPNFDRLGSTEYTAGWLEEAQETSRRAADVLASRVGRNLNKELGIKPRVLLTCNPAKNWLYTDYYIPYTKRTLPADKKVILATVKDNTHLPAEYSERLEQMTDKQLKERLVDGNWEFEEEGGYLISSVSLANCVHVLREPGEIHIGVDVALNGERADKTQIVVTCGNAFDAMKNIDPADFTADPALFDYWLAESIFNYCRQWGDLSATARRIDVSGVGSAIYRILTEHFKMKFYPFKGSIKPFPRPRSTLKFWNLRAQAYWEAKEKIRLKKFSLPANYDEELWQELTATKYTNRNDIIAIEDKAILRRRLGRSPDKADALIMALLDIPERTEAASIAVK